MPEGLRQRIVSGRAQVATYVARDGREQPIELAYDVFGAGGKPLVLVMGIGSQRIFWDETFCGLLVQSGFQVIRFDHRDTGESTRLDAAVPRPGPTIARRFLGVPVPAPYTLSDMAADVIGLLDALDISAAHVVGASLGGMVGQHLALEHAARVRSLTSIMSSPGARRFAPRPSALRALLSPAPRSADEAGLHIERTFSVIGSKAWPIDRDRLRALGVEAYARGFNPRGFLRQLAAVCASGDRGPQLPSLTVPTLVIHGTQDPMFPLSAGRTLARRVPHGTWLPIAGMGHDLPSPLWPMFAAAIARHAERADTVRSADSKRSE